MHADDADITWGHRWDRGSLTVVGTYQKRTELAGYDRDLTNDQDYRRYGGRNADFFECPNQADIYSVSGSNLPAIGAPYAGVPANYKGPPTQQEFVATAGKLNQCSVFRYTTHLAGTDRAGVLLDGVFNPTASIQIYADLLFSYVRQSTYNSPLLLFGAPGFQVYTVSAANPFNPFGETVGVSEMVETLGRNPQQLTTSYVNPVLGARGPIWGTWAWDLAVSQSGDSSHYYQMAFNSTALQAALNSPSAVSALNPFIAGPLGPLQRLQSLEVIEPFEPMWSMASFAGARSSCPPEHWRSPWAASTSAIPFMSNNSFFPAPPSGRSFIATATRSSRRHGRPSCGDRPGPGPPIDLR